MVSSNSQMVASGAPTLVKGENLYQVRWAALGTHCEVKFTCGNEELASDMQAAVIEWVERFEARYSRFRSTSELSEINAAAGIRWVEVSEEMDRMLDVTASIFHMTDGLLDASALPLMRLWNFRAAAPKIPSRDAIKATLGLVGWQKIQRKRRAIFLPETGMALDFGGWGKEYAVDAVVQLMRNRGISNGLVDFGHDIRSWGAPLQKPAWHIGLEDPARAGSISGSIALRDGAVASSGDYLRQFTMEGRRFGHIIDPRTGEPVANDAVQATVIAPSCLQAGVLSTTAFILGPSAGIRFIQDSMAAEGMILSRQTRQQTRGFFRYVVAV